MLLDEKRDRLLETLRGFGSCAVAFSGGVDSAVVAKAAQLALGNQAVAVTGVSASLAAGELEAARQLADLIGIRHEILQTDEFAEANYVANPANRCYFCKTELYQQIEPLAARLNLAVIANGANLDDAGDWRPGTLAATEHRVRSPLAECGFTKDDVRCAGGPLESAGLGQTGSPVSIKPRRLWRRSNASAIGDDRSRRATAPRFWIANRASAISSRRFGAAGSADRGNFAVGRAGDAGEFGKPSCRQLGFKYVALDLEGFRSGSQNEATGGRNPEVLLPVVERGK